MSPADLSLSISDHELLAAYALRRDEAAFAQLVRRHEDMVLAAARRVLGREPEAREAAQDAFALLARSAAKLDPRVSLGGWLYLTAVNRARQLRRARLRREARETARPDPERAAVGRAASERDTDTETASASSLAPMDSAPGFRSDVPGEADDLWARVRPELDAALAALPARLRDAVVLCYLENVSRRDAALKLGCGEAALAKRLTRGVERLRGRLRRRGLVVSAGALGAWLAQPPSAADAAGTSAAGRDLAASALAAARTAPPATGFAAVPAVALGLVALALLAGGGLWAWRLAGTSAARPATVATDPGGATAGVAIANDERATRGGTAGGRAARFANAGDFQRRLRLALHAETMDELCRLLGDAGVTLSRAGAERVFAKLAKDPHQGIAIARDALEAFLPYLEAWVKEDGRAAARWLLGEVPEQHRLVVWQAASALRQDAALEAELLAEYAAHPLLPALRASLLSRRDPAAALALVERMQRENSPTAETLAATTRWAWTMWWKTDPRAAAAWFDDPSHVTQRLAAVRALARESAPETRALARELLERMSGNDRWRATRELAARWAAEEPREAVDLLLSNPVWSEADNRHWLGYVLQTWAERAPEDARRFLETRESVPSDWQGLAAGWARRDLDGALAWAQTLQGESGRAALNAVIARGVERGQFTRFVYLARSRFPEKEFQELVVSWGMSDPAAARAWLESLPAGEERRSLAPAVVAAQALREPEVALELLARENARPDAELSFRLAQTLAVRLGATPAALIEAVADDPAARRAAVAGAAIETLRADPAAGRALVETFYPREASRDVLLAAAVADETLIQQQPAWLAGVLAEPAASTLPARDYERLVWQLAAEWAARDTPAALGWAVSLTDAREAGLAHDGILDAVSSLTTAQQSRLAKLPPRRRPAD